MSDASPSSPPHASSPGPGALVSVLGLALTMIGLALLGAFLRPLSAEEAELVLGLGDIGPDPAGLQAAWNSWAGSMPRVLRGAGLIGFIAAVGALFALGAPASRSAGLSALLVFASVPAVWMQGTGIGGGAPYLGALFALVAALRFFGVGAAPTGALALAISAGLPFALQALASQSGADEAGASLLARRGEDLDLQVFGVSVSFIALALTSVLLVLSARRRAPLAALVIGTAAAWLVFALQQGASLLVFAMPSAAAALALVAGASAFRRDTVVSPRLFLVIALFALAGTAVWGPFCQASPLPRQAEALDWITGQVDQRALVIHHGPSGSWRRYLEERGHRTGHSSLRSHDPAQLRNWADRAVLDGLNRIALTISEDDARAIDLETALGPKWKRVPLESAPALVQLYAR
jgi:hypothetical protein